MTTTYYDRVYRKKILLESWQIAVTYALFVLIVSGFFSFFANRYYVKLSWSASFMDSLIGTLVSPVPYTRQLANAWSQCDGKAGAACVDGWQFLLSISRAIFAIGMLTSVIAQVLVDKYFRNSELLNCTQVDWNFGLFVEKHFGWSNVYLVIAMFSLFFINNPDAHFAATFFYLYLILWVDSKYASKSVDLTLHPHCLLTKPSLIVRRFADEVRVRVDYVSVIPLSIVLAIAAFIYYFGNDVFGERAPWNKMAEIFISGAVGFHLIAVLILTGSIVRGWNTFLINIATAHRNASVNSTTPGFSCADHCWLAAVRIDPTPISPRPAQAQVNEIAPTTPEQPLQNGDSKKRDEP